MSSDSKSERISGFQFSIWTILMLTAVVAAIMAILRPLNVSPALYGFMAVYASALAIYAVFRFTTLWRRYVKARADAVDSRQALMEFTENVRNRHREKANAKPPHDQEA